MHIRHCVSGLHTHAHTHTNTLQLLSVWSSVYFCWFFCLYMRPPPCLVIFMCICLFVFTDTITQKSFRNLFCPALCMKMGLSF